MTEPPGPPLPPSGPPSGLNFSRWTLATPLPPRPAETCSTTRSTNVGTATWVSSQRVGQDRQVKSEQAPCRLSRAPVTELVRLSSLSRRDDVDDAAAALG